MPRAFVLAVLVLGGCRHYWVPERALDAYASLPRAERRVALVPAQRSDGTTTFVSGRDARPLRALRGDAREVRVAPRPSVAVGIVLMLEGAALVAGGAAIIAAAKNDKQCSNDACGAPFGAAIGGTLIGVFGTELIIGSVLVGTGAAHMEHGAAERRFQYLP